MATTNGNFLLDDDVFDIEDESERDGYWEAHHFASFGAFAHPGRQSIWDELHKKFHESIEKGLGQAYGKGAESAARYLLAKGVVESTTKATVDAIGRRGAVVALGNPSTSLTAGKGAFNALKGVQVSSMGPAVTAAMGQMVAEMAAKQIGITDFYTIKGCGLAGAVAAGAAIGGPAGAAVGAAGVAAGEVFGAISRSGLGVKGPNDNWAYIETGHFPKGKTVEFSTYCPGDGWKLKSYWNETKGAHAHFKMSAGQGQQESFQLHIYNTAGQKVLELPVCFYRDVIRVRYNQNKDKMEIIHGKSSLWKNDAGKTQVWSCKF